MSDIIVLKDVKKYYYMGDSVVKAIDGISLSIKRGEFVSIMGPSGSGKSTAMNLVGSLDTPTHGSIYLDGKNIEHMSESQLAQLRGKKIGFVFQSFNLIPNLNALDNVSLPLLFQGVPEDERKERAVKVLTEFGLKERLYYYPNQLSGGQQQRVAIARALVTNPEVILADEPTGNLDTKSGEIIMTFLEELNKKGKTIILVTHDQNLGLKYAQRIFWIKDGKIEKITKKIGNKWILVKSKTK